MTTYTHPISSGSPQKPKRSKASIALLVVVAVLVALVAAGIGGEFYLRHKVTSCLGDSLSEQMGGPVDVGLSPKPMLLTMLDKKIPYITVDSKDATFGQAGGPQLKNMQVQSRFDDVRLPQGSGQDGSIASSTATVTWPTTAIQQSLQTLPFGGLITGITTTGADGSLQLQFVGGLGSITLQPQVQNGRVVIDTLGAQAFGIGLPTDAVSQVVDLMTGSMADYPMGLTPTAVKVSDAGIQIGLAGGRTTLQPASGAQSGQSGCSLA